MRYLKPIFGMAVLFTTFVMTIVGVKGSTCEYLDVSQTRHLTGGTWAYRCVQTTCCGNPVACREVECVPGGAVVCPTEINQEVKDDCQRTPFAGPTCTQGTFQECGEKKLCNCYNGYCVPQANFTNCTWYYPC